MTNKDREKKIKLLKGLTEEQIINELKRRRGVNNDFKLMWVHKDAFFKTGESIAEIAEKASKEAQAEAEQEQLKEKLKKA